MSLGTAGAAGDPPTALTQPTDVVTNTSGDIFVIEGHSGGGGGKVNRVTKFSKEGSSSSRGAGPAPLPAS